MTQVSEVMTRDVRTLTPQDSIVRAAQAMDELDVGVIPVCEGERLVGMVTDRDIVVRGLTKGGPVESTRLAEVMTGDPRWCFEDQSLDEVLEQMREVRIRRIAVFDHERHLVGMLSLGDVAVKVDGDGAGVVLQEISEPAQPDRSGPRGGADRAGGAGAGDEAGGDFSARADDTRADRAPTNGPGDDPAASAGGGNDRAAGARGGVDRPTAAGGSAEAAERDAAAAEAEQQGARALIARSDASNPPPPDGDPSAVADANPGREHQGEGVMNRQGRFGSSLSADELGPAPDQVDGR